jgi:8-hydroxy-5-deazaflavin:NADPH oxidoreductase
MQIAIIGTGNVGSAIARGLKGRGHVVTLGVREASRPDIVALAKEVGARLTDPQEAAQSAEVVVLALPWDKAESAVLALGDLTGRIVIDCMNPLAMIDGVLSLAIGHTTSGAEQVQAWLPAARVVKTLNQVGAEIMQDNANLPHRPVQFMAGNDPDAKIKVAILLADLGFEPLDAGDLVRARILEPFAMVWINQAIVRGKGRHWALAAVSPIAS